MTLKNETTEVHKTCTDCGALLNGAYVEAFGDTFCIPCWQKRRKGTKISKSKGGQ